MNTPPLLSATQQLSCEWLAAVPGGITAILLFIVLLILCLLLIQPAPSRIRLRLGTGCRNFVARAATGLLRLAEEEVRVNGPASSGDSPIPPAEEARTLAASIRTARESAQASLTLLAASEQSFNRYCFAINQELRKERENFQELVKSILLLIDAYEAMLASNNLEPFERQIIAHSRDGLLVRLRSFGIQQMEVQAGVPFDPRRQRIEGQRNGSEPRDVILEVTAPGYELRRPMPAAVAVTLRMAEVIVSAGPAGDDAPQEVMSASVIASGHTSVSSGTQSPSQRNQTPINKNETDRH